MTLHNDTMNDTGRVEAFSDGVLAIAITLLVLDLRVPARESLHDPLLHELAHDWPAYAAYLVSFLVIGIIWVNHHAVFKMIARVDRVLLFVNLTLLLFVVAIPFTTRLLSAYLTAGGGDARTAAMVYSAVMLAMSLAFGALYAWPAYHPDLLVPDLDPVAVRRRLRRFSAGNLVYALTIGVAAISAPLCLAMHFVIALYYCFEQTGGERLRRAAGGTA
jgi:uncharacterized membrane protein